MKIMSPYVRCQIVDREASTGEKFITIDADLGFSLVVNTNHIPSKDEVTSCFTRSLKPNYLIILLILSLIHQI